ncbi:MAG TPA: sugar phosphate isomerase/epimerase [Chthonomonadales bacterium]|nr:sugar phosphate isomerase/epimerase [Chthonomonadales bacterium]
MGKLPIAVQLYTLRDDAAKDFPAVLKQVAGLGYAGVELAGTHGMAAADLKRLLDDLGLKAVGSHTGIEQLETELSAVLDYNEAIGNPYVVCPWMPEERRQSADGWKRAAETLAGIGEACQTRGMRLCYHNHAFEFERFNGATGLDILFGGAPAAALGSELDTYWVRYGGEDPVAYLRKLAGRVPLVHLKDMLGDESRGFAEVGEGVMDWPTIAAEAGAAGAEWLIVEQDVCQRPPIESVEISLRNLRRMGIA